MENDTSQIHYQCNVVVQMRKTKTWCVFPKDGLRTRIILPGNVLDTLNDMYIGKLITGSQKHGLLVCLPKHG
jgi:hypothetical protein